MTIQKKRPLILISNDDGIDAAGILNLTKEIRDLGDIVIFAPDGQRSGASASITTSKPVSYRLISKDGNITYYTCNGTPVDCIKLAMNEALHRKPDLVISGINHGGNHALSVHYSGTMGAVFEGCVFGIPSLGVSLYKYTDDSDFSESCRIARIVIKQLLRKGLPGGIYLNLNIPDTPCVKGIKIARQTKGKWIKEYNVNSNPAGEREFWLTGEFSCSGESYDDNDINYLDRGFATIVPCKIDVTDYSFIDELGRWKFPSVT
jgi:5'-nucleotidase